MESNERHSARERLVTALLDGQSWQQVSSSLPVPLKRVMACRLLRAVRLQGKSAWQDRRQGHPSQLRSWGLRSYTGQALALLTRDAGLPRRMLFGIGSLPGD